MDDTREKKRRKRERVYVVVLLAFIVLFTWGEIHLLRLSAQLPFVNSIFFFGLMNLNIVLIMLLLFLVFRNVVKVLLDDRRGRMGSRLKSRLVFAFVLFSIIPTVLLFSVSAFYIKTSFDRWFGVRVGGTLQKSIEVVQNYYENFEDNAGHFVRKVAENVAATEPGSQGFKRQIERFRSEYGLDAIEYYPGPFGKRVASIHPERTDQIPPASLETLKRAFAGNNGCDIQNLGEGELVRCGIFLGAGKGVLFANYFIPLSLASQLSEISLTYADFKQNNPLGYPIKSTYFGILSMMTLLILFSAIWTGFYVARRLSVPIEELAKGTEEIARGNLNYRIPMQRTDELGRLVESFNVMSHDLQTKSDEIESSTRHLRTMNRELTHRQSYIDVLLKSVQSGVISLDENGNISVVNQAAVDLLGVPEKNIVGKPYWVIVPEEHRKEFRDVLTRVYGTAKPVRKEMRVQRGPNEWINLMVTLSVLHDESHRQMGVVAVIDDVTEMQKVQRITAWREVAKRIAHEIKNPLTPIQLSVQRLRKRYLEKIEDDGTFGQATEIILKEVDSLKTLVSEFSSFSRLPELQKLPDDLNEIALEAVNLFRAAHEAIDFDLELDESLPKLSLDRSQMKRVLINIFDNAVSAMQGRGRIHVRTEHDKDARLTRMVVADEGCGIEPSEIEKLFEPYFSTKEGGTGLGLAIVHRIISDHGAVVQASANQPQGTRFVVEFPDELPADKPKRRTSPEVVL